MSDVQVQFGADISALTDAVRKATGTVSDFADAAKSKFDSLGDTVRGAAAAFGVGFGADAIKNWVESSAQLGETIENAAAKLGTTAEQASQLSGIAALTGTAFQTLQTDMERFNLNLGSSGNETSRVAQGLKALGLNAREFIGVPIPQQLELLAEAASKFADGGNKTAAIMAVLGRSGAEMIPYLDRGKEGLEELQATLARTGATMSNDMAGAFAKTDEDIHEMTLAWQGLSNKIFDVVNPAIDASIREVSAWIESLNEGQVRSAIQEIAAVVGQATISIVEFFGDIRQSWDELVVTINDTDLGDALQNKIANWGRSMVGLSDDYFKNNKLAADLGKIDSDVAASNAQLVSEVQARVKSTQGLFALPAGADTEAGKLKALLDGVNQMLAANKPQTGTMQIGGDKGADEALDAQVTALNSEIAHYKEVEAQKQALIESEVKTKTMSAEQGRAAMQTALQAELQDSMAVYKQEETLLAGQPQKLAEVLKQQQELQDQYAKAVQKLQIEAAEQSAEAWQKGFQEINSAFDSQISGLIKGTTTWQKAWQSALTDLLTKTVQFFVNAGIQEVEYVALQLAGQKAVTAGAEVASAVQLASGATKVLESLITDAKAVFGAVFAFLAPELGPAAAVPAAAAAGTVAAGSYAIGSWELPSDMFAQVHKGEMIVPAAQTPWAQHLMANATGGPGGGDIHHHHTWNMNITGRDPEAISDAVVDHVAKVSKALSQHLRTGRAPWLR